MSVIQRGLVAEMEADNMTSQAGHHGGGSQLYPNQWLVHQGFVKIKAVEENILSRLRSLFRILSSICFCWKLLCLCITAFMLSHAAHGEEQTGICKLMDPAIIWDMSSAVNVETIDLCPCSSTMGKQLPMKWMNMCIPHFHLNVENHCSPYLLRPPSPSGANVKYIIQVVATVWASIGLVGLAGRMLYKSWGAFTEADINRGLMSEPAVPRRSDPTFEIPPCIDRIAI